MEFFPANFEVGKYWGENTCFGTVQYVFLILDNHSA